MTAHARPDWQAGGFGLYIHWPFCLAKCPYCDFNSHVARTIDHAAWRRALVAEVRHMRDLTGPRRLDTIFFGGGTPSLMEPATVAALIGEADRLWGLAAGTEITLEANPTSAEAEKFRAYAAAGVNRLSMGVQALNDADLRALGRMHSVAEAEAAFEIAREAFPRVSFDLIYARMGQTVADWEAELARALGRAVDHFSLYQLTIEPGTRFSELYDLGKLKVPADDVAAEMYEITQQITAAAGLPAYEVSNHARPGAESRHNLIYWRYGDYAGIGPGAHGRLTLEDGSRVATATALGPDDWLAAVKDRGHGLVEEEPVARAEQATEYMLMAMRLAEGADLARHRQLAGAEIDPARIAALAEQGLVAQRGERLAATARGRVVLNRVLAELLA
jgi:oxygen-independent coproporphyrinogen-3 oxidase